MKHLIRFAILGCIVTVLFSTLFLQTAEAKAKAPLSGGGCAPCEILNGVAAVSATDVWAVGYNHNSSGTGGTLTEHWNGIQWSVVPSPNVGSTNDLFGVAAVSATDVWAVGNYFNSTSSTYETLIEQWNGKKWSVVPSPNPGSYLNDLSGVAVVSATDVWAVGSYDNSDGTGGTVIEQWNGKKWSVVPPGSSIGTLYGVAAISATDVWAVGGYFNSSSTTATLVEQWNGKKWSVVKSPNKAESFLYGVGAVSTTNVWAVGDYFNSKGSGFGGTLIEQWNGTQWSVVPSPNPSPYTNNLSGVAAVSATDVWAVGNYYSSNSNTYETLIEQWNGTQWSVVPSPNVGSSENDLHSVAAVSATNVWGVGDYFHNSKKGFLTLTEQWNGTQWGVVPSPNI